MIGKDYFSTAGIGNLYAHCTRPFYAALVVGALGYSLSGCATATDKKETTPTGLEQKVISQDWEGQVIELKDEQGRTVRMIVCGPKVKVEEKKK